MVMHNCYFEQNSAEISGGALYIDLVSPLTTVYFHNTVFVMNKAELGGGAI